MKGNSKIVNKIAAYLRHEITYNTLKQGMHLGEISIARKFKISRVPVREAFRLLQSEGYLKVIPNKGCYVTKISLEYVYQTSIVYRLLAPVVLEKAIPKYNNNTYIKADKILCKIENTRDFDRFGYYLWDFAKLIYSPSNMKYLVSIFDEIYKTSIRLLNELLENKEITDFKVIVHRQFIELCKQNKKDEAIALWCDFIDKVSMQLLKGKYIHDKKFLKGL